MTELSMLELDGQHAAVLPVREEMLLDVAIGSLTALNNITALNNVSVPVNVGAVNVGPVSVL